MAGLCLADEPNVSKVVALEVLETFARQVNLIDSHGAVESALAIAATELAVSHWANDLSDCLLNESFRRDQTELSTPGPLLGTVREKQAPTEEAAFTAWLSTQAERLSGCEEREAVAIAWTVFILAFHGKNCQVPDMADALIQRLSDGAALSRAAAWALWWLNGGWKKENVWHPSPEQLSQLLVVAASPNCNDETVRGLSMIFKNELTVQAVDALLVHLPQVSIIARQDIIRALGAIGDTSAMGALLEYLHDQQEERELRQAVAVALDQLGNACGLEAAHSFMQDQDVALRRSMLGELALYRVDKVDRKLLSSDLDGFIPWLDPQAIIPKNRIEQATQKLEKTPEEIKQRYEALAEQFGLKLEWQ